MKNTISRKWVRSLLCLSFLWASYAQAQTWFFDHYGVEEGLPHSRVYAVHQDPSGYVWLGLPNGLTRFDGREFALFGTPDGLAGTGVKTILTDPFGVLWVGHWGGAISRRTDSAFNTVDSTTLFIKGDVYGFVFDAAGYSWISTFGSGLVRFRQPSSGKFEDITFLKGAEGLGDQIAAAVRMPDGALVCAVYGLGLRTTSDGTHFEPLNVGNEINPALVISLCVANNGQLIAGDAMGNIVEIDPSSKKTELLVEGDGRSYVFNLACGWDGTLYGATSGKGLVAIDPTGSVVWYNEFNGLKAKQLNAVCPDREGNLLIGSRDNGLFVFKGSNLFSYGKEWGLPGDQVWAILNTDNALWAGTESGVAFKPINSEGHFQEVKPVFPLQNSFQVRCMAKAAGESIYVGTLDAGLWRYDARGNCFVPVMEVNVSLPQPQLVTSLAWFGDHLWVGTAEGLYKYRPQGALERFTRSNGLAGNDILALVVHNKVLHVVCRSAGLTIIGPSLKPESNLATHLLPLSACPGAASDLWVGTEGQGVVQLSGGSEVRRLTRADGLLSDFVPSVAYDKGWLYVGTTLGMNRIHPDSNRVETYTRQTGFTGVEVKSNAVAVSRCGVVWFGTAHGINCFNPMANRPPWRAPEAFILKVHVNMKPVEKIENLDVSYSHNNFYFEFGSISVTYPDQMRFRYRLVGAVPEWSNPVNQRFVSFPGLSPGQYRFEVQTCDAAGQWRGPVASFAFEINPPFWQTPWFSVVVVVVLGAMVVAFFKYRERKLKTEKTILEAAVRERTAELASTASQLEMKNRDITDSINYARRIQLAIMRPEKDLQAMFPSSFIFYRPKDIVSGDFYWFSERKGIRLIAAADCTGHGVPGAFMSMIGISYLNEIINERKVVNPAKVLDQLRAYIISVLQQTGREGETKDGMDIALVAVDQKNRVVHYSGAFNSLYFCRTNTTIPFDKVGDDEILHTQNLLEIKGNKMPVGTSLRDEQPFTLHSISYNPGDSVYVATDGFIDQFGGPGEKKFMARRLRELISGLAGQPSDRKSEAVDKAFDRWKGNLSQTDDVLLIGIDLD